ncbi:hypothetical protein LTR54_003787 [Friedmanniomyces endolithicus]|uniref:Uncharacterized protein n=1 Tax=Friedmanniomyces endolithicus TaxID=329885 RepID=A0AAN6FDY1_9PEZI|nr:hypothetical protein LTS00_012599 [Friedmanniomyces endolithicus]KAK0313397.1 hypothetical protein LTR82_013428 [Friedmanniomyces endolithicus]KAK1015244.1 hypothetical protein LTR54_003787 [Friedmanniomyces endolithicus]KAK1064438.1 hypothetical protein LTR74_008763 [Friedmanniomyces endolithicus]
MAIARALCPQPSGFGAGLAPPQPDGEWILLFRKLVAEIPRIAPQRELRAGLAVVVVEGAGMPQSAVGLGFLVVAAVLVAPATRRATGVQRVERHVDLLAGTNSPEGLNVGGCGEESWL